MPGVGFRMHKLSELLHIKTGPGAAILPPTITRIHMEFHTRLEGGHMGPRKLLQENLPRLKFWNPDVPIIVNKRVGESECPAIMSIYLRDGATARREPKEEAAPETGLRSSSQGESPAPAPDPGERVWHIDMKGRHSSDILRELLETVGATPLRPTLADEREMAELKEVRATGAASRARDLRRNAEKKKEEAFMAAARDKADALSRGEL